MHDFISLFCSFESSDIQSWLLFYPLLCLVGFLSDKYLQHFVHFSEAVYILLGSGIIECKGTIEQTLQRLSGIVWCEVHVIIRNS